MRNEKSSDEELQQKNIFAAHGWIMGERERNEEEENEW